MGDFVRGFFERKIFLDATIFQKRFFFSFVAYVHFLPVLHTYLRGFFLAKYFFNSITPRDKERSFFKQQQIKRKNFCFVFL